jgi:hypothetical protein
MMSLTQRAKLAQKALSKDKGYTYEEMLKAQKDIENRSISKTKKGRS